CQKTRYLRSQDPPPHGAPAWSGRTAWVAGGIAGCSLILHYLAVNPPAPVGGRADRERRHPDGIIPGAAPRAAEEWQSSPANQARVSLEREANRRRRRSFPLHAGRTC